MNSTNNRILLAPNAFKGSLSAFDFCKILTSELEACGFQTTSLPLGDGGDGTAEIIAHYLYASPIRTQTEDALGRVRLATYYLKGNTAIIELAEACGLKHLKRNEYDILNTNTAGFGILINHAIQQGANKLILCIGGSASVDGGTGALEKMGLTIISDNIYRNKVIDIKQFDIDHLQQKFKDIDITILCDVDNFICGPKGAAKVFAPQKGASSEQVVLLEKQLHHWADLLKLNTGKDVINLKHGGAAGGIAAAMYALLNAKLISGSEYCLSISHFCEHLSQAHIVITGEGKIDKQSLYGKIPGTIAMLCRKQGVPVYAVAGLVEKQVFTYFDKVFTMSQYAHSIHDSIKNAPSYLRIIAQNIVDSLCLSAYSD